MLNNPNEDKNEYLSIGALAKSFEVHESTIRRIEEAGLLKPAIVSSNSGYRYYDRDNVAVLAEVFALKSCGFSQNDIRDYFLHPGDYFELLKKLQERQQAINLLVDRFARRIPTLFPPKCEIITYDDSYCLGKQSRMIMNSVYLNEFIKDFLFEAIREKSPINYCKSVMICTESTDYRSFQVEQEQNYTICIPLKRKIEHQLLCYIPSSMAVCLQWDDPTWEYASLLPLLEEIFEKNGLVQTDKLKIVYEVGGHLGEHIPVSKTFGYLLIPVRAASDPSPLA